MEYVLIVNGKQAADPLYANTGRVLSVMTCACIKADSHIACHAHAVPLPSRAAKVLECVFPIDLHGAAVSDSHLPCCAHAIPNHGILLKATASMAVERGPAGQLPAFGFCRLSRGVPRSYYQTHTNLICRLPI